VVAFGRPDEPDEHGTDEDYDYARDGRDKCADEGVEEANRLA
jgi:hypothetical protein